VILFSLLIIISVLVTVVFKLYNNNPNDNIINEMGGTEKAEEINNCIKNDGLWHKTGNECVPVSVIQDRLKNSNDIEISKCIDQDGIWLKSSNECISELHPRELKDIINYFKDDLKGGETARKIQDCVSNDKIWINYKQTETFPNIKREPKSGQCLSNINQLDLMNYSIKNPILDIPKILNVVL
jgi:hypothetical protein